LLAKAVYTLTINAEWKCQSLRINEKRQRHYRLDEFTVDVFYEHIADGVSPSLDVRFLASLQPQSACPTDTPLAPGATCTINVSFTPSFSGTRAAALMLYDNALGSPQGIGIAGTGQAADDFSLSVAPAAQSIVAGNAGSYTVNGAVSYQSRQRLWQPHNRVACLSLRCEHGVQ
jgi:hypothetical protein